MRTTRNLATVSVLALALTACGGPAEEEDVASGEAEETVVAEPAASDAEGEEGTDGDAAEGEETAEEDEEETAEPEPEETPEPEPTPEPQVVAAAPAGPPSAFTQCQICHATTPGQNGIGPSLAGVFGRGAASVANFSYTDGMRNSGLTWDDATLNRYLTDPAGTVPGTTMAVGPLSAADRQAIINYLKTL